MARPSQVDEYGMGADAREAALRAFGGPPPGLPTRRVPTRTAWQRIPWTALAIFALALAIAFHAMLFRYATTVDGVMTVRIDRLTGRIVRCYGTTDICRVQVVLPPLGLGALPSR